MVKLSTGREVELKVPTIRQRMKLRDLSLHFYNTGKGFIEGCLDAALIGLGKNENDVSDYTDEELIEIGTKVFELMNVSETDKKK